MSLSPIQWGLESMLPNNPAILLGRARRAQESRRAATRGLLSLTTNRVALVQLLSKPVRHGVADILGVMGMQRHPPRAFYDIVLDAAGCWGLKGTLIVAVDILISNARNPAAVLRYRLRQPHPLSAARKLLTLGELITRLESHAATSLSSEHL